MLQNRHNTHNTHITHLILSGGGSHGSVHVGALRFLYVENMHKAITHISCCSVGSYIAMMHIFGFSIDEMENTIKKGVSHYKCNFIQRKKYIKYLLIVE